LTFDRYTGRLYGTAGQSAIGTYTDIAISATSGGKRASLPAFAINVTPPANIVPATLGSATVSWVSPTINVDGTPLTDLAGFRVFYGMSPNQLDQKIELPDATFTSVQIEDLAAGTYYFAVKAYTTSAVESDVS